MPYHSHYPVLFPFLPKSRIEQAKIYKKIVTVDVPQKESALSAFDVQDTVTPSAPALARTGGLVEITQAEKEFAAYAAAIRAEDERGERLVDIIA